MLILERIPSEYSSQINTARGAMLRSGEDGKKTRRGEKPLPRCGKEPLRCWSRSPAVTGTTAKSPLPAEPRSDLRLLPSPTAIEQNASSRAMPMRSTSLTGFAVDQAASTGIITFFNLSSTVVKARKLLARDGLSRQERVGQWYRQHRLPESPATEFKIDADELARIHAQVLATFPR